MMFETPGEALRDCRSTSDLVCETIRRAIILKKLPLGERLVEAKVAKELGVSITPVRQAFAQLANQGMLTVYPFKGTYVTVITKEYVQEVNFVRERLETAAVELCFERLTQSDADELERLTKLADQCFHTDLSRSVEYDMSFHQYFFERCGNQLLVGMWNMLDSRVQFIQAYSKPETLPENYLETRHSGITSAVRAHDLDALVRELAEHIRTSNQHGEFPPKAQLE